MERKKVQKQGRDERTQEDYPTSAKIHSKCRVVFLHSSFLPCFYTFSGPFLLETKFYKNFSLVSVLFGVSKPTSKYCIVGNFWMVQFFVYFEHIKMVPKLEPTKILNQDYLIPFSTATFLLLRCSRCSCNYGSLDHRFAWWKKHTTPWVKTFKLVQRVSGVWLEGPGKFEN